jgi:LytS/YehU family sensor histidine kinase
MGSTLQITLLVLLANPYAIQRRSPEAKLYFFLADTTSNLIGYAVWVAITSAFVYYRTIRDRELDSEKLQAQLVAAQLKALKMQLNPHFLFNTLNSISSLMRADVELADTTMEKLAVLLRIVLNKRDQQFVSLREEVELLEVYLEIEQVRFGPRLQVKFQVQPEALDASIPDMILQPLLENAIVHGISRPNLTNRVRIVASLDDDWLVIAVENDSDVRPSSGASEWKMGSGLESVVLRLQKLYPGNHKFDARVLENGLARVMLQIPFSIAEVGAVEEVVYAN